MKAVNPWEWRRKPPLPGAARFSPYTGPCEAGAEMLSRWCTPSITAPTRGWAARGTSSPGGWQNGYKTAGDLYECYVVGPESSHDSAHWRTELSWPVIE